MPLVSLLTEIMGKASAKPEGRREGGRLHKTSVWYLKERGEREPPRERKATALS